MPKGDYCIYACNGGVACGCCDEEVFVPGLKPFNKKLIDSETNELEKAGRVKKCSGGDHLVIVCEDCINELVTICACCVEEVVDCPYEEDEDDE